MSLSDTDQERLSNNLQEAADGELISFDPQKALEELDDSQTVNNPKE